MNPNPTCKLDCRFSHGVSMTTMAYYPPVYDKHGNNVNPDMNSTSGSIYCSVCKKNWTYSTINANTTYFEANYG
jgi:hypothetical protein